MNCTAWDQIAAKIEESRVQGFNTVLHWPSYVDRKLTASIEWNGGLLIIDVTDSSGKLTPDLTCFQLLDMFEECGQ